MRKKIKIPRSSVGDPEQIQIVSMKSHFPHFINHRNKEGNLVFEGTLRPALNMPIYKISIEYRRGSMPKVKVIDPVLVEEPPHFYHEQGCICLYKPENFKWTSDKLISNHIVRWTACWLYFYEVWKEQDVWLGPEASHNNNEDKKMTD